VTAPVQRLEAGAGIGPVAVLLGISGWLFPFIGSSIPAFWGDEAASNMSAERPLALIWPELGRVDAVHGAYYVFLHFWIDAFGASELSVRLPSTVADGAAVAGTAIVVDRLFTHVPAARRIAIMTGAVMILLPRVDHMAAEGRSYAIGATVAVWLTVFLRELLNRRVTRLMLWFALAAVFAFSICVFLYLVLLALVFPIAVLATRPGRAVVRRWFFASAVGTMLAAPVIVYALSKHGQIALLAHHNYVTVTRMVVTRWFGNPWPAIACWALILVAVITLLCSRSRAVMLLLGWLTLPISILILGNTFIAPVYSIRYLSLATPAVAILIAVGVSTLFSRGAAAGWIRVQAVVAPFGLAQPTNVFERTEFVKDGGSDLRQAAQVIGAHANQGDAVVFDVTLRTPYTRRSGIWDSVSSIAEIAPSVNGISTVWDLELSTPASSSTPVNVLAIERLGYSISRQLPVHRTVVYELIRETP